MREVYAGSKRSRVHGMAFRAADGSFKFALHQPNAWLHERTRFFDLADEGKEPSLAPLSQEKTLDSSVSAD